MDDNKPGKIRHLKVASLAPDNAEVSADLLKLLKTLKTRVESGELQSMIVCWSSSDHFGTETEGEVTSLEAIGMLEHAKALFLEDLFDYE